MRLQGTMAKSPCRMAGWRTVGRCVRLGRAEDCTCAWGAPAGPPVCAEQPGQARPSHNALSGKAARQTSKPSPWLCDRALALHPSNIGTLLTMHL